MNPNPSAASFPPGTTKELLGALQAVHFVLAQLERKSANMIWKASILDRPKVIDCIMTAAWTFADTIEKCPGKKDGGDQGGGQGPNCRPGFHEEFGICVPNNA